MGPDQTDDRVDDDEILYRRVLGKDTPIVEGVRRLSSQAFTDRSKEPSVDRARLRNNCPERTQLDPTCAVFSVTARQVRQIELPRRMPDGREEMVHPFDVRPEPTDDNPSHAVIYAVLQEFRSRSGFDKLLKELRKIAIPVILPSEDP
jgi:hypothetical protein